MEKTEKETCFLSNRSVITALRLVFHSDHFWCGAEKRLSGRPRSRRNFFFLQVLPAPIKSELWLALWLARLTWLANSVIITADTEIWERATNQHLLSYNTATLLQPRSQQQHRATPWAWGGISAVCRSLRSVTEKSQSWGCGRRHPDYTASTITNSHE